MTVVIPSRNRSRIVFDLLRYLRQDLEWDCPIIVVDQSDDGGRELHALLQARTSWQVEHIYQDRRGTGCARNEGALAATTPWLLFLDDDVRPVPHYLEAIVQFIETNPWVDAAQGFTDQRDGWDIYQQRPETWRLNAPPATAQRMILMQDRDGVEYFSLSPFARYETLTVGIGSGNFAIRRSCFHAIGGFDEQIEGRGDDSEFGLRLWWYGYRSCLCPAAVVFHLREESGGTRETPSFFSRLLAPEPCPGWTYFYMKWFPGTPYHQMIVWQVLRWLRRPWALPIKLARLRNSIVEARRRLLAGPIYLSAPTPRTSLSLRRSHSAGN